MHRFRLAGSCLLVVWCSGTISPAAEPAFRSHPPMRPLPAASDRPLPAGRVVYVSADRGNDAGDGSQVRPWKTLRHAAERLEPGDTLCLRGGVYSEHVRITRSGTAAKPITIRSHPGELAIVDGGLPGFQLEPETAWEPAPDGADGEFRSVNVFPDLGGAAGATNVLGNFADSMVPLHGYRYLSDLRSRNEYFSHFDAGKTEAGNGIYCGPGLFYDLETGRIHIRLAHTRQPALGDDNYRGETDPRKLPLVIAAAAGGSPLSIEGVRYLRVEDLVVRGSRLATISVADSANVIFDGVTAYGGSAAFQVQDTAGLRVHNCAFRGIAAPWTFRGSLKYRAIEARIFSASGWNPTGADNRDFELDYCEFTDCVDGLFLGNCKRVRFHHNLVDNLSDDGLFLTARTAYDGTTPGGDVHISHNVLARCLTTFAFGVGHGRQKATPFGKQTGSGVFIARNVFDFRRPVHYQQPGPDEDRITSFGRVASDHGGPTWEPMNVYHNTMVAGDPPFRGYYLAGLGGHMAGGTSRRVFNNIVVQATGTPGRQLPEIKLPPAAAAEANSDAADSDAKNSAAGSASPISFQADGNLHWSGDGTFQPDEFLKPFRASPQFAASQRLYPPGWTRHDIVADPRFVRFESDWRQPLDLRIATESPAVDAGVEIPSDWPHAVHRGDRGRPDVGALPAGTEPWRVGVRGRLTMFGGATSAAPLEHAALSFPLAPEQLPQPKTGRPVAVVEGYPAFDAPLLRFALNKHCVPVEDFERAWLPTKNYSQYAAVVIVGDLARAKIEPHQYGPEDIPSVRRFLEDGGTLLLMRGTTRVFARPESRTFLEELTGVPPKQSGGEVRLLRPEHRWLVHLGSDQPHTWLASRNAVPLRAARGEQLIGDEISGTILVELPVGRGRVIYVGWELAASLPSGRLPSTLEQEQAFEEQMQVLERIVEDIAKNR